MTCCITFSSEHVLIYMVQLAMDTQPFLVELFCVFKLIYMCTYVQYTWCRRFIMHKQSHDEVRDVLEAKSGGKY